jgi:hypothetical protein
MHSDNYNPLCILIGECDGVQLVAGDAELLDEAQRVWVRVVAATLSELSPARFSSYTPLGAATGRLVASETPFSAPPIRSSVRPPPPGGSAPPWRRREVAQGRSG